ncbi:MAG TPA: MmgE/PrpD family protein [Vicinamibacterales bacterium]|nr:MmgE/PrpD family protein [Vicinamibacterales bacterium]
MTSLEQLARFVVDTTPSAEARANAQRAVIDTIGVALAGSAEPAARIVRESIRLAGSGGAATTAPPPPAQPGGCSIWGTPMTAPAPVAVLANGTAAHALDFDDMCFISLAHPSAPLVPAIVAIGEFTRASLDAILDAYVVGFEVQARLGKLMNPRHYQRGWHCTSTLGVMSAAAGAARLLGLDAGAAGHALAIAASSTSGLKENFGTMVKPLHAGMAARDGVLAALFAKSGLTASDKAIDGPQGYLHALDAESEDLASVTADLGSRWEILDTGITVKLYPSCAGTHPSLDAVLDLRSEHAFTAGDVEKIEIDVDPIVPTILIYERPSSPLEGKFSMPFCVASAVVHGRVSIDTFDDAGLSDRRVGALMPRVTMRVDPEIGGSKPALTEARVRVGLKDGRILTKEAHGARGYPTNPASAAELEAKFLSCATRVMSESDARAELIRWRPGP